MIPSEKEQWLIIKIIDNKRYIKTTKANVSSCIECYNDGSGDDYHYGDRNA